MIGTTNDSAAEAMVHRVLRATGRIVPLTEDEVEQAEALVDEANVVLPEKLRRPPSGPSIGRFDSFKTHSPPVS